MNEKPDRLKLLKNRYLAQITERERELVALRDKLKLIDELETDAKDISPVSNGALKYADWKDGVIGAALDAVNSIGGTGITTSQVAKHLKDNGFIAKGKNFLITVGIALNRLAEREKLRTEKRGSSRLFMPKT